MTDSIKSNIPSNSGRLIKNILDISNVSQRECAENMGSHDKYLSNFIYKPGEIYFGRNFSYNFLASIYHALSINRKNIRANEEFDKIIQNENNLNYGLKNKLLIPALERHILALAKIEKIIFDESQGQILDNYIQQIFPEEASEYDKFLRNMDHQREGFKNIENVRLAYYEPKNLAGILKGMKNRLDKDDADLTSFIPSDESFKKFKKFEKRAESINNFYFVCEKLRESYLPSFYSPTDFREVEMPYFNKGNFLIKRSIINNLKKSNIVGGEVVIKSGQFSFEPNEEKEVKQKKSWFFGKRMGEYEEHNEEKLIQMELDKVKLEASLMAETESIKKETKAQAEKIQIQSEKILEDYEDLKNKVNITLAENKKLKEELLTYKKLSLDVNKENEQEKLIKQGKDVRKLAAKGKKITLADIDWLVNKHGNTKIIRDFVNKLGLFKLDPPESEKIPDLFEDSEKIILPKEEKKRA